jgi:integrase
MTEMFPANAACLPRIPRDPARYKEVLQHLAFNFNSFHATKSKPCSRETSEQRLAFLYRFFDIVREKFKIDPRSLKRCHIRYFYEREIARAKLLGRSDKAIRDVVANSRAHLAFFELWIGKAGLTEDTAVYLRKNGVNPSAAPTTPVRGSAMTPEGIEQVIEEAFENGHDIGGAVLAMFAFGLRPLEACSLKPFDQFKEKDGKTFLEFGPRMGTKGGRPRVIELTDEFQFAAADILHNIAGYTVSGMLTDKEASPHKFKMRLTKTAHEALKLAKSSENGSLYSFRHGFAQRLNALLSENKSGGVARHVSRALGHHRPEVTRIYTGSLSPYSQDHMQEIAELLLEEDDPQVRDEWAVKFIRSVCFCNQKAGMVLCINAGDWGRAEAELLQNEQEEALRVLMLGLGSTPFEYIFPKVKDALATFLQCPVEKVDVLLRRMQGTLPGFVVARQIVKPHLDVLLTPLPEGARYPAGDGRGMFPKLIVDPWVVENAEEREAKLLAKHFGAKPKSLYLTRKREEKLRAKQPKPLHKENTLMKMIAKAFGPRCAPRRFGTDFKTAPAARPKAIPNHFELELHPWLSNIADTFEKGRRTGNKRGKKARPFVVETAFAYFVKIDRFDSYAFDWANNPWIALVVNQPGANDNIFGAAGDELLKRAA